MSRNNKVAKTPAKKEKIQCIFHRFYIVYVLIYSVSEQEHPFSVQEQGKSCKIGEGEERSLVFDTIFLYFELFP
jgi:alpha-D-ribose 1-methylphosphonate 5-phosphate C-P lyase